MPDFFLDVGPEELGYVKAGGKSSPETAGSNNRSAGVGGTFAAIQGHLSESLVKNIGASYQFNLSGRALLVNMSVFLLFLCARSLFFFFTGNVKLL